MPLTKLDTSAALIVIDLQKGIVGMPTMHRAIEPASSLSDPPIVSEVGNESGRLITKAPNL